MLLPDTLKGKARDAFAQALLRRGLARERRAKRGEPAWRRDEAEGLGMVLVITAAGLAAIGVEDEAEAGSRAPSAGDTPVLRPGGAGGPQAASRPASKQARLIAMLSQEVGCTVASAATELGWLPHTTRAALTGLRRKGFAIERIPGAAGASLPPSHRSAGGHLTMRRRPSPAGVEAEVAALGSLGAEDLCQRWRSLTDREPASGLKGELLRAALAHRLQEDAFGGLRRDMPQRLATLARPEDEEPDADGPPRSQRRIKPGARLLREWQGRMHEVVVTPDGYLWNGSVHPSLSTIALRITGTSWNGWRFFGIDGSKKRGDRPRGAAAVNRLRRVPEDLSGVGSDATVLPGTGYHG